MTDFNGSTAVVTGGASGIGLAIAKRLAEGGAKVACLDLAPGDLPDGCIGIRADVADDAAVTTAIDEVVARLGGIDILVNNAGVNVRKAAIDVTEADWDTVLDVNL